MWARLALAAPASATGLHEALQARAGALAKAVTQGAGALAGLGLPSGIASSGSAVAERAGLEALLTGSAAFLALTPYNLGQHTGEQAYLTPEAALALVKARLASLSGQAVLMLLLPGEDPGHLSAILAPLCRVYPSAELEQLLRRAGALATLEQDKFVIPAGPAGPDGSSESAKAPYPPERASNTAEHPKGRAAYELLGAEAAIAEAVASAGAAPLKKLQAFAVKRSGGVGSLASAFNVLASGLAGSFDFYAAYLEGAGLRQLEGLVKSAPVSERYKSCSLLCWWGSPASITFLKELFGV